MPIKRKSQNDENKKIIQLNKVEREFNQYRDKDNPYIVYGKIILKPGTYFVDVVIPEWIDKASVRFNVQKPQDEFYAGLVERFKLPTGRPFYPRERFSSWYGEGGKVMLSEILVPCHEIRHSSWSERIEGGKSYVVDINGEVVLEEVRVCGGKSEIKGSNRGESMFLSLTSFMYVNYGIPLDNLHFRRESLESRYIHLWVPKEPEDYYATLTQSLEGIQKDSTDNRKLKAF